MDKLPKSKLEKIGKNYGMKIATDYVNDLITKAKVNKKMDYPEALVIADKKLKPRFDKMISYGKKLCALFPAYNANKIHDQIEKGMAYMELDECVQLMCGLDLPHLIALGHEKAKKADDKK